MGTQRILFVILVGVLSVTACGDDTDSLQPTGDAGVFNPETLAGAWIVQHTLSDGSIRAGLARAERNGDTALFSEIASNGTWPGEYRYEGRSVILVQPSVS